MTIMQGDWHDFGFEMCATALDLFVTRGFTGVYQIGLAIVRMLEPEILKTKDICEVNQVMVIGLRDKFENMLDKVSFFDLVSSERLLK